MVLVTRAFIFPGQGAQAVGMGTELCAAFAAAREVMEEADDALGFALSRVMAEGPDELLTLTEHTQPALLANSIAVLRALRHEAGGALDGQPAYVAGHSLGEYTALAASGALSFADAITLVRRRGRAMQEAVPAGVGAMAALLGVDLESARAVADAASATTGLACDAANDNGGGQVVLSGDEAAVRAAIALAAERGFKKAIMLKVSAPFHSRLMRPAAEIMARALAETDMAPPEVPLIANVTAEPVRDPEAIRRLLVEQVTGTVRWRETVLAFKSLGVEELVEIGTGKVLSGLTRRIDRDLGARSVGLPADIDAFLSAL